MFTKPLKALLLLIATGVFVVLLTARAQGDETEEHRYTFSFPFAEDGELAPRGGTTDGPYGELATHPSEAWRALRAPGISDFERDRRAILAMAGPYRATFDFIETVRYSAGAKPPRPYQSWGTEYVYVAEDTGERISLQHILVMFVTGDDGEQSGPYVMKHWRQDWRYEDTSLIEYRGDGEWRHREIPEETARGAWSQAVFQVDDFVRYESIGRWEHDGNYSAWTSGETWRPLPRREYSVREDYDVLVGTNRHTILPTGWLHEQDNRKLALAAPGQPRGDRPWLARELGVNRYERVEGFDFSAGHDYWRATAAFWRDVRAVWSERLAAHERFRLRERAGPDAEPPYAQLFERADAIAQSPEAYDTNESRPFIEAVVDAHLVGIAP